MLNFVKKVVEKYNSKEAKYLSLSPRGKWEYVLHLALFFQKLVGAAMLDKNFKVWWYTYGLGIAFLDICVSFLYTIWYYQYHSDTPLKGLLFFSFLGVLIPSQIVYQMILDTPKRNTLRTMVCFSGEHVYPTFETNCSRQYLKICDQNAKKLLRNTIQILGLIYFSSNIFPISMTLAYIIKDEIQLPLPVIFPFTDLESRNRIIINFVNQAWISFMGVIGNVGIEIPLIIFKNSVCVMAASICYSIDELSAEIVKPERSSNARADAYFRNIIIQVQDFDRFLLEYSRIFYWRLLYQPLLLALGISLALFFYLSGLWYAGVGAAIYCYTQLYMPCDIGNEVQISNDKLLAKLQEVPWYLMSEQSRCAYAHLVHRLQNGAVITMGPFAVLNYETLSDITKRIYSLLMMLLKMDM